MAILTNLESRGIVDNEKKVAKSITNSKLKTYKKSEQDKTRILLQREMKKEKEEEFDPYSTQRSSKGKPSLSRINQMANTGYQTTLLEKILQSQNNPELVGANQQFQQNTLNLLGEVKDILTEIKGYSAPATEERVQRPEAKKREVSDLAKAIAEGDVSGIMNSFMYSAKRGADKFGIASIASAMKDVITSALESGMLKEMVKDTIQDSMLSVLGARNKALVKSFKENPIETIQDMVNSAALSNNPILNKLAGAHMTKQRLDPEVNQVKKDVKAKATFDVMTHTTINTVIPDLLSRLVAQAENKERIKFDHDEQKWMTVTQILDKYSGKDSVSKYTKDLMNTMRDFVNEGSQRNTTGIANKYLKRNADGTLKKNADNKVMFNNDQMFITFMKTFTESGATLSDLMTSAPSKLVEEFRLDKDLEKSQAVVMVSILQDGLLSADQAEVRESDKDFRDRKSTLNNITEFEYLTADIGKKEYELYTKLKSGTLSKKSATDFLYGDKFKASGYQNVKPSRVNRSSALNVPRSALRAEDRSNQQEKNASYIDSNEYKFGTVQHRKDEYSQSSRGYDATPEELKQVKYSELHANKQISDREYKKLLDGGASEKLVNKVDQESKRLAAAYALYAKFTQTRTTAYDMAKMSGEPIGAWAAKGYFTDPMQCLSYINSDGEIDYSALTRANREFNREFISDLDEKIKKESNGLDFSLSDPVGSINDVLDSVFTDPGLVKKLGIGGGSAAGYALGKLINNHTFIKSPKLGWLLGAVGAGVMSMERTQNYLAQTLGPAGRNDENGYSNREIIMAKLMSKWLPSVGLGGKTAQLTYKFMTKLGPAGQLMGIPASILTGLAVGALTPTLTRSLKKRLFDDDGKGNKGFLKAAGRALRKIPGVNELFATGRDNRKDEEVLGDTISNVMSENDARIAELAKVKKKTKEEMDEYKGLIDYNKKLGEAYERVRSIGKTEDSDTRNIEMERFRNDFLSGDAKIDQKYQTEITKRDRRNVLGDAAEATINVKSKDELAKIYAQRKLRDYDNVNIDSLSDEEKKRYEMTNEIASGKSITDMFQSKVESYLQKEGNNIDDIADGILEGDNLATKLGYSVVKNGWTDENGVNHKGLLQLESREEFDDWLANIPEKSRNYVNRYLTGYGKVATLKKDLRDIASVQIDASYPGLGPKDRQVAIEHLIKSGMLGSKNISSYLMNKFKIKKSELLGKFLNVFEAGGVSGDDLEKEKLYADKIISLSQGGQGTGDENVNSIVKMKDLKKFKFRNGSRLSVAGCSIAAFNNALNFLGIGGVSIDYLIDIANSYLTTDGGVTSDFMRDMARRLNLGCKIYNTVDNSFTNEMLAKLKPSGSKAIILLLRNSVGDGSHFVNLRTVSKIKSMIDDPETNGITEVSTSTLIASLLEVIVVEKEATGALKASVEDSVGNYSSTIANMPNITNPSQMYANIGNEATSKGSASMEGIAPSSFKGKPDDGVVNVRIVDDLTLPLKMNDGEAARELARQQRGSASTDIERKAAKGVDAVRKNKGMAKEYAESQKMQEDISTMATAMVEGGSTGKGGAGSGKIVSEDDKNSLLKHVGSASGGGLALTAGSIILSELLGSAKDSFKKMFKSKDTGLYDEEGNRQDAYSGDKAGHFARFKQFFTASKGAGSLMGKAAKAFAGLGGKFGAGLNAFRKNPVETVSNIVSAPGKKIAEIGDDLAGTMGKLGGFFKKFPGMIKDLFKTVFSKIPFLGDKLTAKAFGPKNIGMWDKITDFLHRFGAKFVKKFPQYFKKHFSKALPMIGLALTITGAAWSFYDGFSKADLWCNTPMSEIGFGTKIFVGIGLALWNELPNLLASLLAMIPGFGTIVGAVATVTLMVLQDIYGGFEGFLQDLGIRQMLGDEQKEEKDEAKVEADGKKAKIEDNITKVDKDGDMTVKLSQKTGTTAVLDPDKAKKKNEDGTYNFTSVKEKNDNANEIFGMVKKASEKYGVNPSVAMSQWALESDWGTATGTNELAKKHNVLFGIKATSGWKGKTVDIMTTEVVTKKDFDKNWSKKGFEVVGTKGDKLVIKGMCKFRAYDTKQEAVDDYISLNARKYKDGLDGYATDPNYSNKIAAMMQNNFNFEELHRDTNTPATQMYADSGAQEEVSNTDINAMDQMNYTSNGFNVPTVDPYVTSAFGERLHPKTGEYRPHNGIDLRGNKGDPVYSIKDGTVIFAGPMGTAGNTIKIKHPDGLISTYMHLSSIGVKKGAKITGGQIIGAIGGTGGNYDPHLHLGLMRGKNYVDPMLALGLDPKKLKKSNSPENISWLNNNKEYARNYSSEIKNIASTKSTPTEGKGGPYTPAKKRPDEYVTSNTPSARPDDSKYLNIIKTQEEQIRILIELTQSMNVSLAKIAKNTEENLNNNMETVMGLSR